MSKSKRITDKPSTGHANWRFRKMGVHVSSKGAKLKKAMRNRIDREESW